MRACVSILCLAIAGSSLGAGVVRKGPLGHWIDKVHTDLAKEYSNKAIKLKETPTGVEFLLTDGSRDLPIAHLSDCPRCISVRKGSKTLSLYGKENRNEQHLEIVNTHGDAYEVIRPAKPEAHFLIHAADPWLSHSQTPFERVVHDYGESVLVERNKSFDLIQKRDWSRSYSSIKRVRKHYERSLLVERKDGTVAVVSKSDPQAASMAGIFSGDFGNSVAIEVGSLNGKPLFQVVSTKDPLTAFPFTKLVRESPEALYVRSGVFPSMLKISKGNPAKAEVARYASRDSKLVVSPKGRLRVVLEDDAENVSPTFRRILADYGTRVRVETEEGEQILIAKSDPKHPSAAFSSIEGETEDELIVVDKAGKRSILSIADFKSRPIDEQEARRLLSERKFSEPQLERPTH